MLRSTEVERSYCDILVRTDVEGLSSLAFDRSAEWIERGSEAAEEHQVEIRELAGRMGPPQQRASPFRPLPDSVPVMSITIEGAERRETVELVREALRLDRGSYVSADVLSDRLSDIDATGLFGLVRSRLDEVPGGVALTVLVQERPKDRFGVGLRYDSARRAALLFNLTLHNRVRHGSVTRFDLRVGEETRARVAYLRRQGVTGRFEGGVSLGWSQSKLRPPLPEQPTSNIDLATISSFLGLVGRRTTFVGLEVTAERATTEALALPDVMLVSGAFVADHESLDRIDFPRVGSDASLKWEWGVTDLVEGESFSVLSVNARSYLPLHRRVTLDVGAFIGTGRGQDLPLRRTFFVGGAHPSTVFPISQPTFHGLAEQELNGAHAQIARAGLRFQARDGIYLRVGVDAGGVMDEWRFPIEDPSYGWGVTLGLTSFIGPVVLEWGEVTNGTGMRTSIGVGRLF